MQDFPAAESKTTTPATVSQRQGQCRAIGLASELCYPIGLVHAESPDTARLDKGGMRNQVLSC